MEQQIRALLQRFLHPLDGGPEGAGWPFERDLYLSDVAAVLEGELCVDYVQELQLLLNDTPQGECLQVPHNRIVAAGPVRIRMRAGEMNRR